MWSGNSGNSVIPTSTNGNRVAGNGNTADSSGFGVNNFLHGMHSFSSAAELQYYLDRMGGTGSRVTITDALHMRIVPSEEEISAANGLSLQSSPNPGIRTRSVVSNGSSPSRGFNYVSAMSSPDTNPLIPNGPSTGSSGNDAGNQRRIVLFCELHRSNSENIATGTNYGAVAAGTGAAGYAPARNGIQLGFCAICQSWMMQSGEHSITFPTPQP
ncbi:unnamed protein product [Orchesella dallaii]|uniref:Uncharacterized protein n=1 Tax=Orchesella dallaii TaxID=48710 RepID=A0ABP1R2L3_9HEXA